MEKHLDNAPKEKTEDELWEEFDRLVETGRSEDVAEAVEISKEIRKKEKEKN